MMRKTMSMLIAAICCAMLLMVGCAKQEMVKKETQPPDAAAVTPPAKPVTPPPAKPVEPSKESNVKTITTEDLSALSEDESASKAFQTIYFGFDASTLSEEARDGLSKNAIIIKKNKGMKVQIQGNCDDRGSDAYNLALGERRAKAAYDYLVTLGVPAQQLYVISYGKERPAVKGNDEAAWAKNRRDDFVVLK